MYIKYILNERWRSLEEVYWIYIIYKGKWDIMIIYFFFRFMYYKYGLGYL